MTTQLKIADDEVYGKIRAAICDAYIAAGKPTPERNWLYSRLVEAKFNHQKFASEVSSALSQVYVLADDMTGDFKSGMRMALEELRERLGFGLEIEEISDPNGEEK